MLFFPLLAILRVAAYEVSMSSRDKMAYPQPATYARNGLFAALTGSSGGASALGGHAQSTNGAAGSFFATYPSACGAVGASPSDAVGGLAGRLRLPPPSPSGLSIQDMLARLVRGRAAVDGRRWWYACKDSTGCHPGP